MIKQLENELQVELLVRTGSGILLTEIGHQIVDDAKDILEKETRILQNVKTYKQAPFEKNGLFFRIGSTSSLLNALLPRILAKTSAVNKHLSFRISVMNDVETLLQSIESKELDFGLLTYREDSLPEIMKGFETTLQADILGRDQVVYVMERSMISENKSFLATGETDPGFRSIFDIVPAKGLLALQHPDVTPIIVCSNDSEFHKSLIQETNAIVAMPGMSYQHFFSQKRFVAAPLQEHNEKLLHVAVYPKCTPEAEELSYMLQKSFIAMT